MGSSRLPGKSLMRLPPGTGPTLLEHCVRRGEAVAPVVVATTTLGEDDALETECARLGVPCFRGSALNVLERFCGAAEAHGFEVVCRLTGDNPLLVAWRIRAAVERLLSTGCDYVRTEGSEPGTHAEVITLAALRRSLAEAVEREALEHVTWYAARHRERFRVESLPVVVSGVPGRWTLDTAEDFEFLCGLFAAVERPLELTLEQARAGLSGS